jgi:hypothetical protein
MRTPIWLLNLALQGRLNWAATLKPRTARSSTCALPTPATDWRRRATSSGDQETADYFQRSGLGATWNPSRDPASPTISSSAPRPGSRLPVGSHFSSQPFHLRFDGAGVHRPPRPSGVDRTENLALSCTRCGILAPLESVIKAGTCSTCRKCLDGHHPSLHLAMSTLMVIGCRHSRSFWKQNRAYAGADRIDILDCFTCRRISSSNAAP